MLFQDTDEEVSVLSDESYEEPNTKGKRRSALKKDQPLPKTPRSESPEDKSDLEKLLNSIKTEMTTNKEKYVVTFEQLYDFIENAQGSSDPLNLAYDYTKNVPELLRNMEKLKPKLIHRRIKATYTRIATKIQRQLNTI